MVGALAIGRTLLLTLAALAAAAPARASLELPADDAALEAADPVNPAAALPQPHLGGEASAHGESGSVLLVRMVPAPDGARALPAAATRARMLDQAARADTHRLAFLRSGGSFAATTTPPPAL